MMTSGTPLTCQQFSDRLADFLEREVDEPTRAAMEAHALACDDCGPVLADLRKLRIDAANLPELAPSRDLWASISERIETPVVEIGERGNRSTSGRKRQTGTWIGLAAAGLVAVTATITHELTKRSIAGTSATVASSAAPKPAARLESTYAVLTTAPSNAVDTLAQRAPDSAREKSSSGAKAAAQSSSRASARLVSNKPTAEQTYDMEISRLRTIVDHKRSQLDPATLAVIEKNLRIIDDAIAQCKEALRKDPASRFLMESLNDALDTKVQLLRTAAMLPTRT
jgi:hypothetical protein